MDSFNFRSKASRHAQAKCHKWHRECLARRADPAWVKAEWEAVQSPKAPDWKRVAVARCARKLGVELRLSPGLWRVYGNRKVHGEPHSTWAAVYILLREGVLPPLDGETS